MRVSAAIAPLQSVSSTWQAVGLHEGEPVPPGFPFPEIVGPLLETKDLSGAIGEAVPLFGIGRSGGSVLVFGLGPKGTFDAGAAFRAGVAVAKKLASRQRSSVAIALPSSADPAAIASALVEGAIVGTVGPGLRKADPGRHPFESLILVAPPGADLDEGALGRAVARGRVVGEAVNLARTLANLPPAEKAPVDLAQRSAALARDAGLSVEVWDRDRLVEERFGGVLAVAAGSDQPPAFVALEHRGGGDSPAIALIGKGVTFDSGGLSLKPSASMEDMKCDMTGAAVVLAVLRAASQLRLPVNVSGYFALTENMTGGRAMKLGDVLSMRNGLTVEVMNTDAEGRLVLADILTFASEQKPSRMIDLATLTGACMVALGSKIAGLFANDPALAGEILNACRASGERAWRMPLDDDFAEGLKSKVADVKNVGGKYGGAITAAKFLQKFVGETPWAHLDIAGPSWADDDSATRDAGGTGCFVRTLIALLEAAGSSSAA